jgi:hypothetical protein
MGEHPAVEQPAASDVVEEDVTPTSMTDPVLLSRALDDLGVGHDKDDPTWRLEGQGFDGITLSVAYGSGARQHSASRPVNMLTVREFADLWTGNELARRFRRRVKEIDHEETSAV